MTPTLSGFSMREECLQPPVPCISQAGSTECWCQDTWNYLRAVAVHFEGIDAGLVPALSLQEGAVFCQLQAGTPKMAPLEYFDPVMLAVLGTKGLQSTATPKKVQQSISPAFIRQRGRQKGALEGECEEQSKTTGASTNRARTNLCCLPEHQP